MSLCRRLTTSVVLTAMLSCATSPRVSHARPPDADLPALVDDSFDVAPPVLLVSDKPVAEEPAVPPGVAGPDNQMTILYVLVAAAGGFVAGLFVGCLFCFATYYT